MHRVVLAVHLSRLVFQSVPCRQGHADCTPGVTGGRLDPQAFERALTQDPPVADAVQGHTAGETQVLRTGFAVDRPGQAQHHFFRDVLDRPRQIHLSLRQSRLRLPGRTAEQHIELSIGHGQSGAVVEVLHVEPERAVRLQIHQMVVDVFGVLRLAVRSQTHDLVLAGVDLEARVVGERRVQQTQRVRKRHLPERLELVPAAEPRRRRRPLSDTVHAQDRRRIERRGVESGRGVGFVVLAEQQRWK